MPQPYNSKGQEGNSMRGYSAIGLLNTKRECNLGGVLRAAHCYGAAMVVLSGRRFKNSAANTTAAHRHLPLIEAENIFDAIPYDCVPVAVEIIPNARPLMPYTHPERAFYIFGPEDGTIPDAIIKRCRDIVFVPTRFCMNLAATVNVILYDRMAKNGTTLH